MNFNTFSTFGKRLDSIDNTREKIIRKKWTQINETQFIIKSGVTTLFDFYKMNKKENA